MTETAQESQRGTAPPVVPRQWIGLGTGIVLAIIVRFVLPDSLSTDGKTVAAVATLMAVWWMTEAIPLAATALTPLVLMPLLGVTDIATIAGPYANPIIFLFMGGFVIALAMTRCHLHTRFALSTVLLVGTSPVRMIGGFMLATGLLSMWISNTATAVMMLPIGVAVLGLVSQLRDGRQDSNFATALMLGIAYAASIGSLGTIIGTPPNAFLQAHLKDEYGIDISFFEWMLFGVPIAAVFLLVAWQVLIRVFRPEISEIDGARELITRRKQELGPMGRPEWTVLSVFAGAATLWVLRGVLSPYVAWVDEHASDAGIAMLAAILLFALPSDRDARQRVLNWEDTRELPWGILLLFGGGLGLSSTFSEDVSGLGPWIGKQVGGLDALPTLLLVIVIVVVILLLTELTSNTATTATFLPIMAAVAVGLDQDVLLFALPVALAATCAFMLPVATPPNAVVYSSGHVTVGQMIRGGVWLNVAAIVLVTLGVYSMGVLVFGFSV